MTKRFKSVRKGALGALMDLYEEESEFLIQTIPNIPDEHWSVIKDKETKDPDCRSYQSICSHIVGAAYYYVELMKRADNPDYKMIKHNTDLPGKANFGPALQKALAYQVEHLDGRWEMSDEEIEKIQIKTGWGNVLDPESLLEHAVVHIMRHHRQILRWINT